MRCRWVALNPDILQLEPSATRTKTVFEASRMTQQSSSCCSVRPSLWINIPGIKRDSTVCWCLSFSVSLNVKSRNWRIIHVRQGSLFVWTVLFLFHPHVFSSVLRTFSAPKSVWSLRLLFNCWFSLPFCTEQGKSKLLFFKLRVFPASLLCVHSNTKTLVQPSWNSVAYFFLIWTPKETNAKKCQGVLGDWR